MADRSMRILHAATEVFPFVKVGGLGDVLGALPQAQLAAKADARIVVPGFPAFLRIVGNGDVVGRIPDLMRGGEARIKSCKLPSGVRLYVVDCPTFFDRSGGPYDDWGDSHLCFAAFAWAVAWLAREGCGRGWRPDVLHVHDWQAALAPLYLAFSPKPVPATVLSIHNVAYQGIYPADVRQAIWLPPDAFHMEGAEFYGSVNFLKGGIAYANRIVTVSPTYAREIQLRGGGEGLEGILARRSADLSGILNGVDTVVWNPADSSYLPMPFDATKLSGKKVCKNLLQQELHLNESPTSPLCVVVSRFAPQKGLDLLLANVDHLVSLGAQLALLGSGDARLEQAFRDAACRHPGHVAMCVGYDEALAHRLIAGGDILLMPSLYEPCGLTQMYALRHGTLPLARRTGGLADTIVDTNPTSLANATATGFLFDTPDAETLAATLSRAIRCYQEHPKTWTDIRRRGMRQDFGWTVSAQHYLELYHAII